MLYFKRLIQIPRLPEVQSLFCLLLLLPNPDNLGLLQCPCLLLSVKLFLKLGQFTHTVCEGVREGESTCLPNPVSGCVFVKLQL